MSATCRALQSVLYLDGTGEQMSIMGKAGGEWGSIKESKGLLVLVELLGALELCGER